MVSRTAASNSESNFCWERLPAPKSRIPSIRAGGLGMLPMGSVGIDIDEISPFQKFRVIELCLTECAADNATTGGPGRRLILCHMADNLLPYGKTNTQPPASDQTRIRGPRRDQGTPASRSSRQLLLRRSPRATHIRATQDRRARSKRPVVLVPRAFSAQHSAELE